MYANPDSPPRSAVTVPQLHARKQSGEKIVVVTAYDASFALQVDAAGIDVVLVGDSLGNVVQGRTSTLPVTLEHMVYHTSIVARGLKHALLIADLPFMSYADRGRAYDAAMRLCGEAQAQMVK